MIALDNQKKIFQLFFIRLKSSNKMILLYIISLCAASAYCQCPDDHDCDGILDLVDLDDDNDGISDIDELTNCLDLTDLLQNNTLLYFEDFGSGAINPAPAIPSLIDAAYCYEDLTGTCGGSQWVLPTDIDDNQYSILNNPFVGFPQAFRDQEDHTVGDVNGYQLVVNASDLPGEMFHKDNIAIPSSSFPQQTVVISVWLSNIGSEINQSICANCCGGAIIPNVDFILENSLTGLPIGNPINSGDISFVQDGVDAWVQYTAIYDVTGISDVNIIIKNNSIGGCGNDVAIDDVQLVYIDVECDLDNDGISDYLDIDSDNDGIYDVIEGGDGAMDTNGDGTIDINDLGFSDLDGNGMDDSSESTSTPDTDGDGYYDYLDLDSDNDGCYDAVEAGHLDQDDDGILGLSPVNVDDYGEIQNQNGYNGTLAAVTIVGGQGVTSIVFSEVSYCVTETPVSPTTIGSVSGQFTVQPSGLSIDNITGEVIPSLSNPGSYQITYTPDEFCLSPAIVDLIILDIPSVDPVLNQSLCEGEMVSTIIFNGTASTYEWTNDKTMFVYSGFVLS